MSDDLSLGDVSPRVPAEIAQRHLLSPDGTADQCYVVTAIEPEGRAVAVFSGLHAGDRATAYARERYFPLHYRILAEPGQIGLQGIGTKEGMN